MTTFQNINAGEAALATRTRTDTKKTITVPVDVCAYIVAFLDHEWGRKEMLACALVCRAWVSIGRSKLFHTVVLKTARRWALFKVLLLPSAPSHIARYLKTVRKLIIQPNSFQESWSHEVLVVCSARLTGVEHITLRRITWTSLWRSSFSSIPPYDCVRVLELDGVQVNEVGEVYLFVCAFPTLSRLMLDFVHPNFDAVFSPTLEQPEKRPGLYFLTEFDFSQSDLDILNWLGKTGYFRRLKRLNWSGASPPSERDWMYLSKMIDSSSLLSLHCAVPSGKACTCSLNSLRQVSP